MGGCLDIFILIYPFLPLSPSLWETARHRLKNCLKGPLNPKQPTNQPTKWLTRMALETSENALGWYLLTLMTLKGSIKAERKTSFTLSNCLMGSTKEKEVHPSEGIGSIKFEKLSDVDISHAVPRRLHSLAYTGSKCVAFADPLQQIGWLIDLKISSPFVATGKKHELRKVVNSGTRLCSYIPETRNIVVSEAPGQSYVLKIGND